MDNSEDGIEMMGPPFLGLGLGALVGLAGEVVFVNGVLRFVARGSELLQTLDRHQLIVGPIAGAFVGSFLVGRFGTFLVRAIPFDLTIWAIRGLLVGFFASVLYAAMSSCWNEDGNSTFLSRLMYALLFTAPVGVFFGVTAALRRPRPEESARNEARADDGEATTPPCGVAQHVSVRCANPASRDP